MRKKKGDAKIAPPFVFLFLTGDLVSERSRYPGRKHHVIRFRALDRRVTHVAIAERHLPAQPLADFRRGARVKRVTIWARIRDVGIEIEILSERRDGAELMLEIFPNRRTRNILLNSHGRRAARRRAIARPRIV